VSLLYYLGLRIHEVAKHHMRDFKQYGHEWWIEIIGKGGGDPEKVPVHPVLLDRLMRFRTFSGLPPLPAYHEDTHLLPKVRGDGAISDRMINTILKAVSNRAADRLKGTAPATVSTFDAQGQEFEAKPVHDPRRGPAHWLRHTSATHQLAVGIELRQVQQNLRHKKLETTLIYSHVADSERHTAMKKMKKLK